MKKIIVHYFIKNHYKAIDRLIKKKIKEIENTYKYEKWLYVYQKLDWLDEKMVGMARIELATSTMST